MKNFNGYLPEKYASPNFQPIEEGIYRTKNPYGEGELFVTSLTFEMDPARYGEEEASPRDIPQTPFEPLLDEYNVSVTDFYDQLNEESETVCYQEFGSFDLEDIQRLRTIIGKQFYVVPDMNEAGEIVSERVVIE